MNTFLAFITLALLTLSTAVHADDTTQPNTATGAGVAAGWGNR